MSLRVLAAVAIALAIAGCGSDPVRSPSSAGTASAPKAAPLEFRLASDGLPMDGRWKSPPVLADLNGDGNLDLVVHPRLGKGAQVFLGDGHGKWRNASAGLAMETSCGGGIAVGDVNRDGYLDIVVADHCEGLFVYLGDGKGSWRRVVGGLYPKFNSSAKVKEVLGDAYRGMEAVGLGDVNGDGFIDIVASSSDQGGLVVFLGDGSGANWRELPHPGLPNGEDAEPGDAYWGGFALDLMLADMNGDGHLDVVAAYYTGPRVWLGDGTGHFKDASKGLLQTQMGGIYRRVAVADVNKDGRLDLAVANYINGAELYLQNTDGSWKGPIDMMPELKGGATALALGDLDGDGNVDVVIGGALTRGASYEVLPHGLFVRWGDSTGNFSDRRGTNLPTSGLEVIWGIKAIDVDRDGRPDVVVTTGGDTGRIPQPVRPPTGTAPVAQQPMTLPFVEVWLNDGGRGK